MVFVTRQNKGEKMKAAKKHIGDECIMVMRNRWAIPLSILIILILAFIFRWDYGPTTTFNNGAIKVQHKVDRWTGRPWIVVNGVDDYGAYSNYEVPYAKTGVKLSTDEGKENARKERNNITRIWFVFVVLTSGLTIYYFIKDRKGILTNKIGNLNSIKKINLRETLLIEAYNYHFTNGGKYGKFVFEPNEIEKPLALKYLADKRLIKRRLIKQDPKEVVYEATITVKGIDVVENDIPLSKI